ncbi:MAG TPA: 2Fe-2S iron-sulfur cluster-binding protein [Gammaproteobacteria bacterium]|nr:2Fe-2S iron-sulfur cluster-binding protein [Gammaproteobacteria bacterium]
MPKVTYVEPDGTVREIQGRSGATVMETAVDNDVRGIVAECGGACSCATCHVYVDEEWVERLNPPDPQEDGMLDCVIERRPNSRLSCQIELSDELDGLRVQVPDAQI